MITVETVCPFCGSVNHVHVVPEDYAMWKNRERLAQDAFPYLSADERELLISGICSNCWNDMFSQEDEEKEEE